jgi:hypothetical protein
MEPLSRGRDKGEGEEERKRGKKEKRNIPFSAGSTTLMSSTNRPWNLTCWKPRSLCAWVS